MRLLLQNDAAWTDISVPLVDRLFYWICTSTAPNILLPTTAILRKMFTAYAHTGGRTRDRERERDGKDKDKDKTSAYSAYTTPTRRDKGKGRALLGAGAESLDGTISNANAAASNGGADGLGFGVLWSRMAVVGGHNLVDIAAGPAETVLRAVVRRLEGTGDLELVSERWVGVTLCKAVMPSTRWAKGADG
jgi:hypothetical protein